MRIRHAGKLAVGATIALAIPLMAAQSASAHAPSSSGRVYDTYNLCTISSATFTHDHNTGDNTASARTIGRVAGCTTIDVFPPGWLAVRLDMQKWTGSAWLTCQSTSWQFNNTWTDELRMSQPLQSGVPDCAGTVNNGKGYFRTLAVSFIWDGSAWRGGSMASPYHAFPAYPR
jgi:hypothetical protein